MRRFLTVASLTLALAVSGAEAQQSGAPHEWLYGAWTGGIFPPADNSNPRCLGQPTVIFMRDVVQRATPLDFAYRQRLIETVAARENGVEFRFTPIPIPGGRVPPDFTFGCHAGPDTLVVERRGENEIALPDCAEMPFPLRRCGAP
jgi:hypothetical protein